jgi:hypothetical protein
MFERLSEERNSEVFIARILLIKILPRSSFIFSTKDLLRDFCKLGFLEMGSSSLVEEPLELLPAFMLMSRGSNFFDGRKCLSLPLDGRVIKGDPRQQNLFYEREKKKQSPVGGFNMANYF